MFDTRSKGAIVLFNVLPVFACNVFLRVYPLTCVQCCNLLILYHNIMQVAYEILFYVFGFVGNLIKLFKLDLA